MAVGKPSAAPQAQHQRRHDHTDGSTIIVVTWKNVLRVVPCP